MTTCIYQANNLVDNACNALSYHIVLPGIKATFQTAADLSIAVAGIFSRRLKQSTDNFFYDPISTTKILFISKPVELLTAYLGMRKPVLFPFPIHYFDRSIISMNQHLHAYTKRINEFLCVPSNLKTFLRRFSFETVVKQMNTTTPTYLTWMNRFILQIRRLVFSVVDIAIRILDLFFRTCFLGIEFGIFSYLKEIILDARNNIYGRLAETAVHSIEKRETKLRRMLAANIANSVTDYLGTRLTSVFVKSSLGLAFYIPTKNLLTNHFGASEWAIHLLGTILLTRVLWSAVIQPTCQPYYETYNPNFQAKAVSLLEFCEYFGIRRVYPIAAFAGSFFSVSSEEE